MTPFRVEVAELTADATLLTLHGTIGALDVDDLRTAAMDAQARRFLIDATDAQITDGGALEVLLDVARRARPVDLVAIIAPDDGELRRVLETTGFESAFAVYGTLRAALDDLDLPSPGVA